ncbi:MAG: undecaprenyl/decaprenyl-phosphate alpha-N-acetylglucosaminyl 1-phosphate transferase [Clostridia bacterium]|nr:undecaprenyl/decaprenyl-phosphate alpha-N-acetylglucosaminyl 1-phosphate transferase [Clostridia bacterium]
MIFYYILVFISAALVAAASMPAIFSLARISGAIDVPRARHMHKKATPLLGGLAIYLGFTVAAAIAFLIVYGELVFPLPLLIAGGGAVVVLGAADDIINLKPVVKFLFQIAIAVCTAASGAVIERISVFGRYFEFGAFSIPITVLWIVLLTNAVNLIDGLDGLACSISAICSLTMFVVAVTMGQPMFALLTLALFGASVGFLPFNFPPAKMFMGDTGAMFLGYAMAVISVSGLFKLHAIISFVTPIIIFAIPLIDTVFSFFRRLFSGKNPFGGDRGHLHYRLVDMGMSPKLTVAVLCAVTAVLGVAAILFSDYPVFALIIIASAVVFMICLAVAEKRHRAEKASKESKSEE